MKTAILNNRYQILETLGRGGFGETFLAIDTHMPSARKCVIKQLNPIIQEPTIPEWMQERFQREAAILEELGDQNAKIPQLYAYFSEGGKFYLVQEWVEGETLAQIQREKGKISAEEASRILIGILPVLEFVHSRHIVHRDIKPDNIILRQGDREPVLIDFGIVKEALVTQVNTSGHTPFSAAIGTPGYMSSEQAAGRPVYSSDLYSLALTVIFLLTGKEPRDLETDSRTGEIIWRKHARDLDTNLAIVLEKAVRFHPRDRFASAKEMLAALQSLSAIHDSRKIATKVVSPRRVSGRVEAIETSSNNKTVAVPVPETKRGNGAIGLLFSLLLMAGVSAGTFALGFALLQNMGRLPMVSQNQPSSLPQPPEEVSQQPVAKIPSEEEKPRKDRDKEESTHKDRDSELKNQDQASEQDNQEAPEIIIDNTPTNTSSQTPTIPQQTVSTVPTVAVGTQENQVLTALGQPTSEGKGYWADTKELNYENIVPDRVNQTFLSDTKTGKIRQAEVYFAQSVDLETMQNTLDNLLGQSASPSIREGLTQVYARQTDMRAINTGKLKGRIQRIQNDRILISVWESNFQ